MKSINLKLSFLAVAFMLIGAATSASAQTAEKVATIEKEASVEIKITGMTCGGCASHVYKVLSETEGVIDNSVKYPGNIVSIKYNPDKITPQEIAESIEANTSYTAKVERKKRMINPEFRKS